MINIQFLIEIMLLQPISFLPLVNNIYNRPNEMFHTAI